MLKLGVNGALGRMGGLVIEAAEAAEDVELVCALERSDHPLLGTPTGSGGITLAGELHKQDLSLIAEAACQIPVLVAPNMSVGVNVLAKVVADVAGTLGDRYDIEIVETHHRRKADAPSGTALFLAKSIVDATDRSMDGDLVHGRHGRTGEKPTRQIGIHAVRTGGVFGDHVVIFADDNERVEVTHKALSRRCFAEGALRAARFLARAPIGMYGMSDVLEGD